MLIGSLKPELQSVRQRVYPARPSTERILETWGPQDSVLGVVHRGPASAMSTPQ